MGSRRCNRPRSNGYAMPPATSRARIAASAPLAVVATRETVRGDIAERVTRATDRELEEQTRLRETKDWQEGVKAMAERRVPNFVGA